MNSPMVRSNLCINCNSEGCKKNVKQDIEYVISQTFEKEKRQGAYQKENRGRPCKEVKDVLVIGASNGYGLASRIIASFGYGWNSVGISYERAESEKKMGTPGWYHNRAFEQEVKKLSSKHFTIEGDAFSMAIKEEVIKIAKKAGLQFDLVIYSIASHQRQDETSGVLYQSCVKPVGVAFKGKTIDVMKGKLEDISIAPATDEEIESTIKVMGGEDWKLWMLKLREASLLAPQGYSIAYSYMGTSLTDPIYKNGTIGFAKKDLQSAASSLNIELKDISYHSFIACMKGIATRSSAIIPSLPLYLSALFKVMKKRGRHEGAIEQVMRLFQDRLYSDSEEVIVDSNGLIRLDEVEVAEDVQMEVELLMNEAIASNSLNGLDVEGYKKEFLAASGF